MCCWPAHVGCCSGGARGGGKPLALLSHAHPTIKHPLSVHGFRSLFVYPARSPAAVCRHDIFMHHFPGPTTPAAAAALGQSKAGRRRIVPVKGLVKGALRQP